MLFYIIIYIVFIKFISFSLFKNFSSLIFYFKFLIIKNLFCKANALMLWKMRECFDEIKLWIHEKNLLFFLFVILNEYEEKFDYTNHFCFTKYHHKYIMLI